MQRTDQAVEGIGGALFGGIGEVGVERGGGGRAVSEQRLDMAQAQTLLEQMGCQGVAQRMDRDLFLGLPRNLWVEKRPAPWFCPVDLMDNFPVTHRVHRPMLWICGQRPCCPHTHSPTSF